MLTFNLGRKAVPAPLSDIIEPTPIESDQSGIELGEGHSTPVSPGDGD
jgi:hypothetical protein